VSSPSLVALASSSKKVYRGSYPGLVSVEPENFPGTHIPFAHRGMVSGRARGYICSIPFISKTLSLEKISFVFK